MLDVVLKLWVTETNDTPLAIEHLDELGEVGQGSRQPVDLRKGRSNALLTGRIFDDRGNLMSPAHTTKKGIRYRYYVSAAVVQGRKAEAGSVTRVPAKEVETIVLNAIGVRLGIDGQASDEALGAIKLRVDVRDQALHLSWLDRGGTAHPDSEDELTERTIIVPCVVQPHKRKREIILPETTIGYLHPIEHAEQQNLVRSIAEGRAWLQAILAGSTIGTIARREKKSERMVRMRLSLAFLDPKLVRAALHGTLPRGVSTRRLIDAPMAWHDQWRKIGLVRPT